MRRERLRGGCRLSIGAGSESRTEEPRPEDSGPRLQPAGPAAGEGEPGRAATTADRPAPAQWYGRVTMAWLPTASVVAVPPTAFQTSILTLPFTRAQ